MQRVKILRNSMLYGGWIKPKQEGVVEKKKNQGCVSEGEWGCPKITIMKQHLCDNTGTNRKTQWR